MGQKKPAVNAVIFIAAMLLSAAASGFTPPGNDALKFGKTDLYAGGYFESASETAGGNLTLEASKKFTALENGEKNDISVKAVVLWKKISARPGPVLVEIRERGKVASLWKSDGDDSASLIEQWGPEIVPQAKNSIFMSAAVSGNTAQAGPVVSGTFGTYFVGNLFDCAVNLSGSGSGIELGLNGRCHYQLDRQWDLNGGIGIDVSGSSGSASGELMLLLGASKFLSYRSSLDLTASIGTAGDIMLGSGVTYYFDRIPWQETGRQMATATFTPEDTFTAEPSDIATSGAENSATPTMTPEPENTAENIPVYAVQAQSTQNAETAQVTNTPQPAPVAPEGNTQQSVETPEEISTQQPAVTAIQENTQQPVETPQDINTQQPSVTAVPGNTQQPVQTPQEINTQQPVVPAIPENTQQPAQTPQATNFQQPVVTAIPENTQQPLQTPHATSSQQSSTAVQAIEPGAVAQSAVQPVTPETAPSTSPSNVTGEAVTQVEPERTPENGKQGTTAGVFVEFDLLHLIKSLTNDWQYFDGRLGFGNDGIFGMSLIPSYISDNRTQPLYQSAELDLSFDFYPFGRSPSGLYLGPVIGGRVFNYNPDPQADNYNYGSFSLTDGNIQFTAGGEAGIRILAGRFVLDATAAYFEQPDVDRSYNWPEAFTDNLRFSASAGFMFYASDNKKGSPGNTQEAGVSTDNTQEEEYGAVTPTSGGYKKQQDSTAGTFFEVDLMRLEKYLDYGTKEANFRFGFGDGGIFGMSFIFDGKYYKDGLFDALVPGFSLGFGFYPFGHSPSGLYLGPVIGVKYNLDDNRDAPPGTPVNDYPVLTAGGEAGIRILMNWFLLDAGAEYDYDTNIYPAGPPQSSYELIYRAELGFMFYGSSGGN